MNPTTVLKHASEHGGPMVLGAGMMTIAIALVGPGHFRAEAGAPPRPGPAVSSSPAVAPPGVRRSPHPTAAVSVPSGGGVLAGGPTTAGGGSDRAAGVGGRVGGAGGGGPTAAPSPPPSSSPPASGSSGGGVSVRLPLGVLPSVGLDLTVGGNK